MGNSRITVLLGAGAMCECTPLTTRYLTDLVAEKEQDYLDEASRRIKTYPLLSEIKTDLENYFHKDEVVSFEDMLHALEMLHSYESANNIGTVKEFKSVFPMFSKLQENYEEKLPHVFAAQNDLISTLVDEIAKYEGGWNNSSNAWFTKFFRQISEHSKIDFYSLNYDTWLEQIFEGQYADGFTKLDEEYNLFSPRAVFNFDDELHSINHLHGQICFTSYPRQYRNRYTWEQPCGFVKANNIGIVQRRGEYPRYYGNLSATQSGEQIQLVPIITGLRKNDKLMNMPFDTYFHHLYQSLMQNSRLLIIGYSFGDLYINTILNNFANIHGEAAKATVITYLNPADWVIDLSEIRAINHRTKQFYYDLFQEKDLGNRLLSWRRPDYIDSMNKSKSIYFAGFRNTAEQYTDRIFETLTL